jgi:putative transposase
LKAEHCDWLLNQLSYFRLKHKVESEHQIWQEGFHPQAITSDEMMFQKLEYLHNNPVKRGLVASPEHWRYSSAHEWLVGALPVLRCDEWR